MQITSPQHIEPNHGERQRCERRHEDEAVVGEQVQARKPQQRDDSRQIDDPAESEDPEQQPQHADGTTLTTAEREWSEHQRRDQPRVGGCGSVQSIAFE